MRVVSVSITFMGRVRFENAGPLITEVEVTAFEQRHHVMLPASYRKFLLRVNGGHPVPDTLQILMDESLVTWRVHYFFGLNDPVEACNLEWVTQVTQQTRPKGLIPIASDEAGNFFYIDARAAHSGTVYFGATPSDQRTTTLVPVCLNLESLIGLLR